MKLPGPNLPNVSKPYSCNCWAARPPGAPDSNLALIPAPAASAAQGSRPPTDECASSHATRRGAENNPTDPAADNLCLACGLCCNGVLFADVKLQPEDNARRLRSLGLAVQFKNSPTGPLKFAQPCVAFKGCQCAVYADRPAHCRAFECVLLKSTKAGRTSPAEALRIIRIAQQRADKVRALLRQLGDADEQVPLGARFRKMTRRLERGGFDDGAADAFGELTLAVHDLNLLLSEAFYPGKP